MHENIRVTPPPPPPVFATPVLACNYFKYQNRTLPTALYVCLNSS